MLIWKTRDAEQNNAPMAGGNLMYYQNFNTDRYAVVSFSSSSSCGFRLSKETELAAKMPEPATAGMPIPGKQESPHTKRPLTGVSGKGKDPSSALIAGP
mmetsp:Transcript_42581/g.129209  ORF Transcript_42581/g.129209 Transcript_42581/m.129209 type:complete len:99 (+) Transcript_42581:193-489(+)